MQVSGEASTSTSQHIQTRLTSLVWSCLDADLHRSAVFYAERYFALYPYAHDARHLYATALLRSGQPHTAYHLVNLPGEARCSGCLEVKAKCCTALGRHRQARDALEECLKDPMYSPTGPWPFLMHALTCQLNLFARFLACCFTASMGTRSAQLFPEASVLHCRSGNMALKGNLPESAKESFRKALSIDPMLWEAFEGLCSLGELLAPDHRAYSTGLRQP